LPIPSVYRQLAKQLAPFSRTILIASIGIPIIWAIAAVVLLNGLKIQFSPTVHHWLFSYSVWSVPIVWWLLGVVGYFGWYPSALSRRRRARMTLASRVDFWLVALFLDYWFVMLLVTPFLLWGGSCAAPALELLRNTFAPALS